MNTIRVRFAPSPTGGLHIGGVRTALYNYLFAKKYNGTFIIRTEDTDQTRFVEGAEKYIFDALKWLGITADESSEIGGKHAPYRQSERKAMYMQYAKELIEKDCAYYAFDTSEELDEMRARLEQAKSKNPSYNAITRSTMRNSLTLPEDEVKTLLENGSPYVIRLKMPRKDEIRFQDIIRGWVNVHTATLDDKVIMKSDGMPTYHLANVVDDHLMEISHVIRGEEWLPSAPIHVFLYQCFAWEMPQFAHLPLLLNPDGQGKLSKRKGAEYGFPVFPLNWIDPEKQELVQGFKEAGYLSEAVINFLALLGWNAGDHQEIFSMAELIEKFSLERVGKAGIKFDINKAKWFNQHYLRQKPDKMLVDYLKNGLKTQNLGENLSDEQAIIICQMMKDRATFPDDFWKEAIYLFQTPTSYNEQAMAKNWNEESKNFVKSYLDFLKNYTGEWHHEPLKHDLHTFVEQSGLKMGKVMPAVRLGLSGVGAGPDLAMIMQIIGKEESIKRLESIILV
jgi:glutamyl-tRNA synthetase